MNQNDIALKKTARHVGVALLIFLLLFYTAFGALEFLIAPIMYAVLGDTLGYTASQILFGIIYGAVFILPALLLGKLTRNENTESSLAPIFPLDLFPFIIMATVAVSICCSYVNSWLGTAFGASSSATETEVASLLDFLLLTFTTAIVPAICEEFLFRKTLMRVLMPFGEGFAIISSAVMFGLMHQNVWQIFYATMAGILLGYVYAKTRSYLCVFLIHLVNNFISAIQTTILSNLEEPYGSVALLTLVAAVIILGTISAFILIFKEKNTKDVYATGSFGEILPPSSNFVRKKTLSSPAKILFLSPSVLIFTIISVLICLAQFL